MNKLNIENFNLKYTLESGQFFLYTKSLLFSKFSTLESKYLESTVLTKNVKSTYYFKEDFYYIINAQTVFRVKQEKNILYYDGISQDDLIYFFSLDIDYSKIYEEFNDKYLLDALDKYRGLRIIRQDLWQCLISFVCSSCSNIPKITKNLELISEYFGEKIIFDENEFYIFPKIGSLIDYDKLVNAKTGYRAKYLFDINKMLTQKYLDKLKKANYNEAKKMLMELPGIGSKVATCICLFSLGHFNAFPVDTWVKQIVEKYYLKRNANVKEIEKFGEKYFGENAGIKQQYLFHYIRNLK